MLNDGMWLLLALWVSISVAVVCHTYWFGVFFFRLNSTKLLLFIQKAAFGIPARAQLDLLSCMEAITSKTSCSLGSQ